MGLLDAYADSTENVLNVMAARPVDPEPAKPKHSAWSAVPRGVAAAAVDPEPAKPKHSAWSAVPRGVAAAAVEIGGNVIDAGTAIGQLAAAATNENARKMLEEEGFDLRTEASQVQYNYARDLRPDPITAGTAENLVFGLSRGLTKAIPAALTLGPYGGALAFGASEGLTDADNLAAQGVDKATRTKVGAVSAAVNAAGVALPVAGKTLAQTVGLVAVGGPLSFITQQQATRSILEAADYHDIAKQYDPLDPVGLTVATLVPAGFAAAARAGARGSAKAPDIVPTRDDIDAAMVHNLTTIRDVHESVSAEIAARPADDAVPAMRQEPVADQSAPQPAKPAEPDTPDAYRAKVEQLATEQPDLVARLDDAGQPVRLADELEAVRRAAQEGTETEFGALDAPLLRVAAECALATGTAAL